MNLRPVSAVRELARDTIISKPSAVRLLAILIEDGFVQRVTSRRSAHHGTCHP
jgi:DNA-binding MarR family transcriptional regulator